MELRHRSDAGHRRAARARERGAAVFLVVLVITTLTLIGLFTVRSAILSTRSSGNVRHMMQTHYVTEYATLGVAAELSTDRRAAYLQQLKQSTDCPPIQPNCLCKAMGGGVLPVGVLPPNGVTNRTCYVFGYQDLEAAIQGQTGETFVEPKPGPIGQGSLGYGGAVPDFLVDMTDLGPAWPPVAGNALNRDTPSQLEFKSVTLSATGQVHDAVIDRPTAGLESMRAHLIVGPLPK